VYWDDPAARDDGKPGDRQPPPRTRHDDDDDPTL
jgi:hypothetical protein